MVTQARSGGNSCILLLRRSMFDLVHRSVLLNSYSECWMVLIWMLADVSVRLARGLNFALLLLRGALCSEPYAGLHARYFVSHTLWLRFGPDGATGSNVAAVRGDREVCASVFPRASAQCLQCVWPLCTVSEQRPQSTPVLPRPSIMSLRVLNLCLCARLLSAMATGQSAFNPDEYWQSMELAYSAVWRSAAQRTKNDRGSSAIESNN